MNPTKAPLLKIRSYTIFIAVGWTLVILLLLGVDVIGIRRQILEIARTEARTDIEKDLVYRQ